MKKLLLLSVLATFALPAFADEPAAAPAPAEKKENACTPVIDACKAAGFKGEKLFKECMKPLKDGKTVANVTVDPAALQACKEAKHGHHHGGKHHGKSTDENS